MNFADFLKNKKVIKGRPDLQKSKALVKMSAQTLSIVQKIEMTPASASLVLSQCYECLRQILEAIALKEGYKVYSHEAFTYYLIALEEHTFSEHFDRLRKLRNGINYYGKAVSKEVSESALEQVNRLIKELKEKYLQDDRKDS